ncbi:hybrid sensor histidine kinase/response regulator transcription factor [Spirosoma validum]|uniref:histidine kinase n=1 Tax=Spirosoma validum TaxID=2771355 RepID=A0A927B292_9BACT|nr:hybrid sensor histidine kinase/response regulator transcription factor [Spirosoma validum]MBD2753912.1 response regulator [Spirosoma validum]
MSKYIPAVPSLLVFLLIKLASATWLGAQSVQLPLPEVITDRQGLPQAFVPAIVQDRLGFIWAATRDGLCRYDGQRFRVFQPDPGGRPALSFAGLSKITLDPKGRIWVTSDRGDLDRIDPRTERFTNISRGPLFRRAVGQQGLLFFCIDRRDRLWLVLTNGKLVRIDLNTGQIRNIAVRSDASTLGNHEIVSDLVEDNQGGIWLACAGGLLRFEEKTNRFRSYRLPSGPSNPNLKELVFRLYVRPSGRPGGGELLLFLTNQILRLHPRTGEIHTYPLAGGLPEWDQVGFTTDSQGRVYFNNQGALFRFTDQGGGQLLVANLPGQPKENGLRPWVDQSDVLWQGTAGAGIRTYDLRPNPFQTGRYRHSFHTDLLDAPWLTLSAQQRALIQTHSSPTSYDFRSTLDARGSLWFNVGSSLIYQLNLATHEPTPHPLPHAFQNRETGDAPCPLATDPGGRIWAVHDTLVYRYEHPQWLLLPYRIPRRQTSTVLVFSVDEQALWLATEQKGLWRLDKSTGQLHQYAHRPADSHSLSNNSLLSLAQDPTDAHFLWIGTYGSGLCRFDKRSGRCQRFTIAQGLPNNVIYSLIPDQQGQLWIATNKGICRLNPHTLATRTFTRTDGLLADEFNRFHAVHLPDDRIILGGLEGITAFYPHQVGGDSFAPRVELTDVHINDQPAGPTLLDSLPMQAVAQLRLAHDQNFITVEFAALQFNRLGKHHYRYRLDGLETHWKETDLPVATYTDLSPGHYTLVVNAANTSGVWSPHTRRLRIRIEPPLWATWWAIGLYGMLVLALGWVILKVYLNRLQLRQAIATQQRELSLQQRELTLQQQQAQQLKMVDSLKSNFFANITHEFRTPLTLILGPAERLARTLHQPEQQQQLATIGRNANQVLGLVNQLLDLSKLEAEALPVIEVQGDLTKFVEETVRSFLELAQSTGVEIQVEATQLADGYWFDADKLERILNNLLGNALKFTRSGDQVRVDLRSTSTGVVLSVADTGIGMAADQLPHIFDRFYQIPSTRLSRSSPAVGTGIGLALVNELVRLQAGRISVRSELGIGTTFTIELPYRVVSPSASVSDEIPNAQAVAVSHPEGLPDAGSLDDRPLVLVVEDNDELARFILDSLPTECRGIQAANGQLGWEQALADVPNLIISDVMMPVMDGYALCQRLKSDLRTSHIPVLLLTAKVALDNRLEGLSLGADDYLTKPFHVAELQARVRNQIATQRQLRAWVQAGLHQPAASADKADERPPLDPFLARLYALLEEHLDEPAYGVDELLSPLGMSRTGLYRKLKALTGLAPADVVRLYRLKRGSELLQAGVNVSETAYRVGFQSATHFARLFRQQYQMTPSQFADTATYS